MDFMKVFDQTVREIKREVNLKVLKVPEIEQKVLDATDNEPWGPHGSALAEIALATKKFTECQLVMGVLWTRLRETGKDWRYVYKSLAVLEYLVAHGSERAVDDIIEHTFQISSLSSFEYVELSGKDMGINVRKRAESIVALLNDKDKIQEVRNKAAANRDKYFGLSSSGVSYKSSTAAIGSSNFESREHYKGKSGSRDGDSFGDSYKGRDNYEEDKDAGGKSYGTISGNQGNSSKSTRSSKDQDSKSSSTSKFSVKLNSSADKASSNIPSSSGEDDFDDFDPRGTTKPSTGSSNEVDLFGDSLIDLMDEPISVDPAPAKPATNSSSSDVDLFADADFVSAPPPAESAANPQKQNEVDLFASKSAAAPATVDLFADSESVTQPQTKPIQPAASPPAIVDPFAAVPLNSFDGSDPFGGFTSFSNAAASTWPSQNLVPESSLGDLNVKPSTGTNPPPKKGTFQVKSGVWADSLSRGLIDLNITAPKKVSLTEVGIVGGLSDGSDEMVKGGPPASLYMGRAMGSGSGLGRSTYTTTTSSQTHSHSESAAGDDGFFSSLATQPYHFRK